MPTIRLAQPTEYPAITQLLADALMVPALFAPPSLWWVAIGPDSTVVGAIGVEPNNAWWLLRSAVVAAPAQRNGVGKALVAAVTHAAKAAGVSSLFCFGTDVGDYWERRGFSVVSVTELCNHVPDAPQIGQFKANGWLADEVAWRKNL